MGRTISAPISCATARNPPSWVLVSRNSSMAAAPASGRNDASVVGTGENVLVSCIIIATTILGAVIGGLLPRACYRAQNPGSKPPGALSSSDETGGGSPARSSSARSDSREERMSGNRAVVVDLEAPGRLVIRPVPDPVPESGEAVVRVRAISLNRGEVRRSTMAAAGWRPGWDLAGVIERPAANGLGPRAGARVVGVVLEGAWAERVAVPANALAELPDKVTFSQAATFPVAGLTALHALAKGGLLLGKRVLLTGATGGVGDFAVQLARLAGAHVTALARRADQAPALSQLGAHDIVVGEEVPATPK